MFVYDPNDDRNKEGDNKYVFANSSGNQIRNEKNLKRYSMDNYISYSIACWFLIIGIKGKKKLIFKLFIFFNKFVNVATNDNKQHYWIVNGEKYAPPENYGHNYTSMMLKLQHGVYPNDPNYNETPIEF